MERHTTGGLGTFEWGACDTGTRTDSAFPCHDQQDISLLEFKVQRCNKILCILFYLHVGMS